MKSILSLFAVLVVLSSPAYSGTVIQMPVTSNPENALTKPKLRPKLKKPGGEVVPLHRPLKLSPWSIALSLAAAGASIYFEDEMNATPYELFMGEAQPDAPPGWSDPNTPPAAEGDQWYTAGYFFEFGGIRQPQLTDVCEATKGTVSFTRGKVVGGTQYGCEISNDGVSWVTNHHATYKKECTGSHFSASYCQALPATETEWPEDNKVTQVWSPTTGQFQGHAMDANTLGSTVLDQFYQTEHGVGQLQVGNGLATVHEWIEVPDANGMTTTVHEWVSFNPTTGTVVSSGQTTQAGSMPSIIAPAAPAIDLPTDYAREDTLASIKATIVDGTGVAPPDAPGSENYSGDGFDQLSNAMNTVADPPALTGLPTLPGYTQSCQTVGFNWQGVDFSFPSASQCTKLGSLKELLAWFLAIVTFWLCTEAVLTARKGS